MLVSSQFNSKRPIISRSPPGAEFFLGVDAGIGAGLVGGGLIITLFSDGKREEIELINRNINKLHKKISVTNKRLVIIAANVTNAMKNIQVILDNINTLQSGLENRYLLVWHLSQIKEASELILILFKLAEISLSWLREGISSSEVVNIETFKAIKDEGKKNHPDMRFPISEISKNTIAEIVEVLEIQN